MPYYRFTPPRTISGDYVAAQFPLPTSSQLQPPPSPSAKVVALSGYSQTQSWRVPPFFGGMGADAATPSVMDQITGFVQQYGLYLAGGLLAYALLSGQMGGKRRRNPRRFHAHRRR